MEPEEYDHLSWGCQKKRWIDIGRRPRETKTHCRRHRRHLHGDGEPMWLTVHQWD